MTDSRDDKMSDVVPPPLPTVEPRAVPDSSLQFDTAEFSQPASMACGGCQQPIATEYYELNGVTLCGSCRAVAAGENGTPLFRVVRAAIAGAVAAFAGGLVYFLVAYLLDMEIGLISIAVGFAVGVAVKWGSYGRGGAPYQAMAVGLTYLAIVSSLMAVGVIQVVTERTAAETAPAARTASNEVAAERVSLNSDSPVANASPEANAGESSVLMGLVVLAGVMLALPFLGGVENIIGIAIIAFGLWEAWKINKRPAITGPHTVASSNAQAAS